MRAAFEQKEAGVVDKEILQHFKQLSRAEKYAEKQLSRAEKQRAKQERLAKRAREEKEKAERLRAAFERKAEIASTAEDRRARPLHERQRETEERQRERGVCVAPCVVGAEAVQLAREANLAMARPLIAAPPKPPW